MNDIVSKEQLKKTVRITKSGASVSSDSIAKIFEKHHVSVLKQIRAECFHLLIDEDVLSKESIGELSDYTKISVSLFDNLVKGNPLAKKHISKYFKDSSYIDSRGKKYPRFELTRKGFDLLVLGFTGQKARRYKRWYIDEFHEKTEIIQKNKALSRLHKSDDMYIQFRKESKDIRRLFTEVIQECELPQRIAEKKDASRFLGFRIANYTKLVYSVLDIDIPKGDNPRDILDIRQLVHLENLEKKITQMIRDNANNNIHYKESYKLIKERIKR